MRRRKEFGRLLFWSAVGGTVAAITGPLAWGQANMLGNPGFESPVVGTGGDIPMQSTPGGAPVDYWEGWNNWDSPYSGYYDDSIPAHSGNQVGKTFGGQTYSGNGPNAGIYQSVPATPGDSYTANGWFVNSTGNGDVDQLNNGETDDVRIIFDSAANGTGNTLATDVTPTPVTENTPTDVWTQVFITGVAPAGSVSVVWMAYFSNPDDMGGALYVDDAYLGYSPLFWNNSGGTGDGATWDVNTNQNWSDGTNEALFPNGAPVTFNDNNNGHYSVNVPGAVQPWSTTFSASGNYTLSGAGGIGGTGSLTLSGTGTVTLSTSNTYSGGTNVNSGKLVIAANAALPANSAVSIGSSATLQLASGVGTESVSSLSISTGGTLDINNNAVIINYGSGPDPIASIESMIDSGYANGSWTGTGIMSTTAQTNAGNYGIGYADSADLGNPAGLLSGQIEIMYTLLGDANLDGKVNGADFAIMAANFNEGGKVWDQGAFTYNGEVNGSDFTLLARNFNQSATESAVGAADLAALDAFAAANGISLANVPEPASFALIALAGAAMLRRSRRRSC
jgi:autotransporter-associated beta strand protein